MLSTLTTTHIPGNMTGLSAPQIAAYLSPASSLLRTFEPLSSSLTSIASEQKPPNVNNENNGMLYALMNPLPIHMQHSGPEGTSIIRKSHLT